NKLFTKLQSEFLENDSPSAIRQLSFMVLHRSEGLRSGAAGYLGTIADRLHKPEQKKLFVEYAVPALGKALHDPSPFVRREAASALESSGDLAIDVLPDLLSRVSSNDDTAWFSIQAIGNLGPKAKEAVPVLLPLLHFNYPETGYNGGMVRQYAVEALGKISADTNVIRAIQHSLNDPDDDVRKAAEEVLKKYNHPEKP
ncbi:MAG: HEAT repeat domain-containing protein, partial [Limisphaerales bacterium]